MVGSASANTALFYQNKFLEYFDEIGYEILDFLRLAFLKETINSGFFEFPCPEYCVLSTLTMHKFTFPVFFVPLKNDEIMLPNELKNALLEHFFLL